MDSREWTVQVLGSNGAVDREEALLLGPLEIGRGAVGLPCPDDAQMADRHARLDRSESEIRLEDLGDGSGVWLRIRGSEGRRLEDGDQLWLGAQILVLRREGASWEVRHHGPDGRLRQVHSVPEVGVFIGRGSELVLDPKDGQLSRRHGQLAFVDGELRFFDRGAHNGSYLRLRAPEALESGAEFRVAAQHFRVEAREPEPEQPEVPVDPLEEATVLNLERDPSASEPEPDSTAAALQESPHETDSGAEQTGRLRGLGARLRSLGRRPSQTDGGDGGAAIPGPIETSPDREGMPSVEEATAESLSDPGSDAGEATVLSLPPIGDDVEEIEEADVAEGERDRPAAADPSAPPPSTSETNADLVLLVIDSEDGAVTLEVEAGKTVLEAVQEAGLERGRPVDWECGDGGCGVCIVGVVEGADRIDPPDPATGEMKTIQITEQVAPDPRLYRLACLARVRGTVRLRKLT